MAKAREVKNIYKREFQEKERVENILKRPFCVNKNSKKANIKNNDMPLNVIPKKMLSKKRAIERKKAENKKPINATINFATAREMTKEYDNQNKRKFACVVLNVGKGKKEGLLLHENDDAMKISQKMATKYGIPLEDRKAMADLIKEKIMQMKKADA